jgi:hypothetical protein
MKIRRAVVSLTLLVIPALSYADTLVLNNGRRLQGELIGVFGREIEFEEREGGRRRSVRILREEIDRIEFDGRRGDGDPDNRDDRVGGIPRGMRERRVNVAAREQWSDTGIDVRAGQQIYFSAEGETRWGPNRRDSAAGERNSPTNAGRPLPDRPAAALIGRIGERDEFFFIGGEAGPFRARASGRLYLGINDDVLTDNSGTLRVIVYF